MWSEFIPLISVRASLPLLKESGYKLFLAINESLLGDPSLSELLREAEDEGVDVGAWLLLPYEDGYWPNEKNAEKFLHFALNFVEWIKGENLKIERIIVDMETPYGRMKDLEKALEKGNVFYLLHDLENNRDPESFEYAKSIFNNLVDHLKWKRIKVMVTTLPFLLDDLEDGDEDVSDMLDIPVYGINWDVVSFMVYRTLFGELTGSISSPGLVESYSRSAVKFFGEKSAIDLGIVGEGYQVKELMEDLSAVCMAGITEFHIYALDTILPLSNPYSLLSSVPSEPFEVPYEPLYDVIRNLIKGIDKSA